MASAIFVLARLFESWHVTPRAASHRISIFGQAISYPAANAEAIVLIVLAAFGLIVIVLAMHGTARELAATRRFHRRLAQQSPRHLRGARRAAASILRRPASTSRVYLDRSASAA